MNKFVSGILLVGAACVMSCSAVRNNPRNALTDLFENARQIKVFSYSFRLYRPPADTSRIIIGDLSIIKSTIKDEIALTATQKDSLFVLLKRDQCESEGTPACYDPRHAIVFYDANENPFGYIEICFACTNYRTSGNFKMDFCYEKSEAIMEFFRSLGITYFDRGEE